MKDTLKKFKISQKSNIIKSVKDRFLKFEKDSVILLKESSINGEIRNRKEKNSGSDDVKVNYSSESHDSDSEYLTGEIKEKKQEMNSTNKNISTLFNCKSEKRRKKQRIDESKIRNSNFFNFQKYYKNGDKEAMIEIRYELE